MKVYKVSYTRSNSLWVDSICYGIFSTKEKAQEAYNKCKTKITEVENGELNLSRYNPSLYQMEEIITYEIDEERAVC